MVRGVLHVEGTRLRLAQAAGETLLQGRALTGVVGMCIVSEERANLFHHFGLVGCHRGHRLSEPFLLLLAHHLLRRGAVTVAQTPLQQSAPVGLSWCCHGDGGSSGLEQTLTHTSRSRCLQWIGAGLCVRVYRGKGCTADSSGGVVVAELLQ